MLLDWPRLTNAGIVVFPGPACLDPAQTPHRKYLGYARQNYARQNYARQNYARQSYTRQDRAATAPIPVMASATSAATPGQPKRCHSQIGATPPRAPPR